MPKTVIVTGATGGIGRSTVLRLASAGFRVIAMGTRTAELAALTDETGCETIAVDICDGAAVSQALGDVQADVLIHAAGILGPQLPLHETPPMTASSIVAVNIVGTINLLRAVIPGMIEQRDGVIVLLGSICATMPGTGPTIYSASKAALQSIAANLRFDVLGTNIRVSEVRLGRVRTGIHNQLDAAAEFYEGYDCVQPENVAETIAHILASPPNVDLSTVEIMPTDQAAGGSKFFKR